MTSQGKLLNILDKLGVITNTPKKVFPVILKERSVLVLLYRYQ